MHRAFEVHKLNNRGMHKAVRLAQLFDNHLAIVKEICGVNTDLEGHEFSLAVEHLELASFYAKKTIAQKFENQDHGADVEQEQLGTGQDFKSPTMAYAPEPLPTPPYIALGSFSTASLEMELKRRASKRG
jgi:hypothetical protein